MSKARIGLLIVLIGLSLSAVMNAEANLITNGDMETGGDATTIPDLWIMDADGGLEGVSSDTPDASTQSLFLDNTSGSSVGHNVFRSLGAFVTDDTVYEFSFWYKGKVRIFTNGFLEDFTQVVEGDMPEVAVWTKVTATLTDDGDPGTPATLKLFDLNSGVGDAPLLIDNVSLTVVPEPASLALIALGCATITLRPRRR